MWEFMASHYPWIFSGVGVAALAGLGRWVYTRWFRQRRTGGQASGDRGVTQTQNVNVNITGVRDDATIPAASTQEAMGELRKKTQILFIDDEEFKVVSILVKAGWGHAKLVKDVSTIDDRNIRRAHILFIDIVGVGRKLGFRDEGLGLACAIMERYPKKQVVVYSAQREGERFHEAFRRAADILPKNADPYEFQRCVEDLALKVWKDKPCRR